MRGRRWAGRTVVAVTAMMLGLTGCGDDDDDPFPSADPSPSASDAGDSDVTPSAPGPDGGAQPDAGDAEIVVSAEGTEYVVLDTSLGGTCEISDTETGQQISAFGFDAETGSRVELSLRQQTGDTTPSGVDEYFGAFSVASGELRYQSNSTDPWPFAVADPMEGTLAMETDDGRVVDVTFRIDCP